MNTFKFTVSTPDKRPFDGMVQSVFLRGTNGDLTILSGHIPFITATLPCECVITLDDGTKKIGKASKGILSVGQSGVLLVLNSLDFE